MRVARWIALLACASVCAGEIQLPLSLEGLRPLVAQLRKEGIEAVRGELEAVRRKARAAGDLRSEAYALAGLAGLAEWSRDAETAERTLREAVDLSTSAGDRTLLGTAAQWFAQESSRAGRSERTLVWAGLAASEFRTAGDQRNLALALHLIYRSTGPDGERRKILEEALVAARAGGSQFDMASIETDFGELLRQTGDLAGAIRTLERTSLQLEQLDAWMEAGHALTLLTRAYHAHGQRLQAMQTVLKAEALLERSGDLSELQVARQELGLLLARMGERERAYAIFEQVRKEMPANRQTFWPIGPRATGLANGYLHIGEFQRAADLALQVVGRRRAPLAAHWILSAAYYGLGRYEDAVAAADQGIAQAQGREEISNISAYRWRALAYDKLGRSAEAARDMIKVAELGDNVRRRLVPDDEFKRLFSDDRLQFVHDAIAVLWRAGRKTEAWSVAEQARARAFLDLMASKSAHPSATKEVANGVARSKLMSDVAAAPLTPQQMGEFASRTGETVLSYWVHPEAVYVWAASPGGRSGSGRIAVREKDLSTLVERARSFRYKPHMDAWRELHRILIQPIEARLPREPGHALAILPHGPLLQLPFAALLNPSGRYLIENYVLRSAPSASVLTMNEQAESPRRYVMIGAPRNTSLPALPGAQREVEKIAALAPAGSRLLSGAIAEPNRVREEASRAGVLHFATHAVVDAAQPFESFLALSDRGRLTAGEIYDLRLRAELVMLSACRSGSGVVSSDGLLGFTRAFLYAGASSVIAPLWDIPDDTTVRLVEEFYRRYTKGVAKEKALREAQLAVLADLRAGKVTVNTVAGPMTLPEHPGLWAGFVLQGGRSVDHNASRMRACATC